MCRVPEERDVNPTLPSLFHPPVPSLISPSPFASLLVSYFLSRSWITRSSPPLSCRSNSPRHRCNVSCRAPSRNLFQNSGYPDDRRQPRYVGDSLSLSSPAFRNIGGDGNRRAARRPRRPWRLLSLESLSVRARKVYLPSSLPLPLALSLSLSHSLNVSVKVSGPTHRSRNVAVAATTAAAAHTVRQCLYPVLLTAKERERERERELNKEKREKRM